MTQEVQPLTWQKRTNIEEHQQFFSKINEIIDNLAPTVDEAEAAIAQATQALADATAAIATANAASAAADAAAQSAQTAAATVAGYDTRLSQVENKASVNQANISSLSVLVADNADDITALQNVQGDYVKKAGAAQTVTSQIMVPTTATGVRDTQIANGTRIQNDLAAYEPMLRTTGNQPVDGIKTFIEVIRGCIYSNKSVHIYDGTAAWHKAFVISTTERQMHILELDFINNVRNVTGNGRVIISHAGAENVCKFEYLFANPSSYQVPGNIALCVGSSTIEIWIKRSNIHHIHAEIVKSMVGSNQIFMSASNITAVYDPSAGVAEIPTADYNAVVYGSVI